MCYLQTSFKYCYGQATYCTWCYNSDRWGVIVIVFWCLFCFVYTSYFILQFFVLFFSSTHIQNITHGFTRARLHIKSILHSMHSVKNHLLTIFDISHFLDTRAYHSPTQRLYQVHKYFV